MPACRLCGSHDLGLIVHFGSQPIAHRLLDSPEDPEETFPLAIHQCLHCGLAQNLEPIPPEKLYSGYNYNFSFWKDEAHIDEEIDLLGSYSPVKILEIGSNDGLFLDRYADKYKTGLAIGVDPNPEVCETARARGLDVINDQIHPNLCWSLVNKYGHFDTVIARQVIEHVTDLSEFFRSVRVILGHQGRFLIDTPDCELALRYGDVSVFWEEHVSFFTRRLLEEVLGKHGFKTIWSWEFDFSFGTTAILAKKTERVDIGPYRKQTEPLETVKTIGTYQDCLLSALHKLKYRDIPVVLYGAGARGVTVVNCLDIGDLISFAVDDQKERQGKFLPGSHLEVRSPRVLDEMSPKMAVLLAVSQENEESVRSRLKAFSISILSPVDILGEAKKLERWACR